jgi:hypothetical protein
VGEVKDASLLVAGIDAALPREGVMFLEGTSIPEVKELLAERCVATLRDDPGGDPVA